MAKKRPFVMEFWPVFVIFLRLRPYSCSKQGVLGFHKQTWWWAFFTLGSTIHDRGWPKNDPFWTKIYQTWQACQHSKVVLRVQKGPKWSTLVFLIIWDPFGPSGPQSCKIRADRATSRCYFFWPVLIFGKSTQKTGENRRKHAKTGEKQALFWC